jgi:hypothetical protein
MSVNSADADANEAVPMPMEQPSNRLSKIVASSIGVLVVTTSTKRVSTKRETKSVFARFER